MSRKAKPLSFYYRIQPNGCWHWTGGRTGDYGTCRYQGEVTRAHIAVYRSIKGDYPRHLELDHTCGYTLCVNPDHLEPVTHKVNALRGRSFSAKNAKKTHCPKEHKYTIENTYFYPDGRRGCKICIKEQGANKTVWISRITPKQNHI